MKSAQVSTSPPDITCTRCGGALSWDNPREVAYGRRFGGERFAYTAHCTQCVQVYRLWGGAPGAPSVWQISENGFYRPL